MGAKCPQAAVRAALNIPKGPDPLNPLQIALMHPLSSPNARVWLLQGRAMSEKISEQSIRSWMEKRQGWAYRGGALVKQFHFKSFRDTIVFVNRIASLADEASQYPEIQIQGGQVRLTLASRAAGVTQKDLELAQAIDFATSAR